MTHWEHLTSQIKDLASLEILDLGSGQGAFLIDAATHGAIVTGLETNPAYIKKSYEAAAKAGVQITVIEGRGEALPFPDNSFDFVNLSEVIEHVDDPLLLLREVHRVLRPGGRVYLSVPNRFGIKDPHFHLYFVNWLPRRLANAFISLFGTHKDYGDSSTGRQNLASMHYYTYPATRTLLESMGFTVIDIRAHRISSALGRLLGFLVGPVYLIARTLYFDSFHLLLTKTTSNKQRTLRS